MAYDSQDYLDAYTARGELPVIHQGVNDLFAKYSPGHVAAIDFGASVGLLCAAMVRTVPKVIGLEGDPKSVARALRVPGIRVQHFIVDASSVAAMAPLATVLQRYQPTLCMMRRVLSEISQGKMDYAVRFIRFLGEHGVQKIVIQGRVYSARSTHPLPSTDAEIEACTAAGYHVIERVKECAVLEHGVTA